MIKFLLALFIPRGEHVPGRTRKHTEQCFMYVGPKDQLVKQ